MDDDDYQGDSRVLFRDGERYGVLIFGWGSCSGCDALQACDTYEEVDDLRHQLEGEIVWGTREETLAYIKGKDWAGTFIWHADETKEFLDEAVKLLEEDDPS